MFESIYSTKTQKQDSRVTICHTGCKNWKEELFEDQAYGWEKNWFSIEIWPVLLP